MKPHPQFRVSSPDEVAECFDGIPEALYQKIWREIVPLYDGAPRSEVNDDFDRRCLAKFWKLFSPDEQKLLNETAQREHERYARMENDL